MSDDITVSDLQITTSAVNYRRSSFDQAVPFVGRPRLVSLMRGPIGNYQPLHVVGPQSTLTAVTGGGKLLPSIARNSPINALSAASSG